MFVSKNENVYIFKYFSENIQINEKYDLDFIIILTLKTALMIINK